MSPVAGLRWSGVALGLGLACDRAPPSPCPPDMVLIEAGRTTVGFDLPRREWMEAPRAN